MMRNSLRLLVTLIVAATSMPASAAFVTSTIDVFSDAARTISATTFIDGSTLYGRVRSSVVIDGGSGETDATLDTVGLIEMVLETPGGDVTLANPFPVDPTYSGDTFAGPAPLGGFVDLLFQFVVDTTLYPAATSYGLRAEIASEFTVVGGPSPGFQNQPGFPASSELTFEDQPVPPIPLPASVWLVALAAAALLGRRTSVPTVP